MDSLVELDLSHIDVSFAEKEDDSAAVAPITPAPPPRPKTEAVETQKAILPEKPTEPKLVEKPKPPEEKPSKPAAQAPVAAPRQAKIDAPPRPLRSIKPEYPKGARMRGEEGNVVLEIEVDERGRCAAAKVASSSGFPELDMSAVKSVKAARFSPAKSGGHSVSSSARITLTFRLKF